MTPSQLAAAIERAISIFRTRDLMLLRLDANERSMTHKLAEYLQREFRNWTVDCEYNRLGDETKRMSRDRNDLVPKGDTNAQTVYPDIIVHRRNSKENLLVIEAFSYPISLLKARSLSLSSSGPLELLLFLARFR